VVQMHDPRSDLKRRAALAAIAGVHDGMRVGLGSGSTAAFAVDGLGRRLQAGELKGITCISTSRQTTELATRYGIPLIDVEAAPRLDIAIDGADEVDPSCDLIKGGGGSLLLEKKVEQRADRLVIIVDHSKLVSKLGTRFALPVEVVQDTWERERDALAKLGCSTSLRCDEHGPFVTDTGNFIVDCRFPSGIADPKGLASALDARPDVRAHGLFLGMADEVIVAEPEGIRSILPR
jgi:ribose 5-phosphate isomerase A